MIKKIAKKSKNTSRQEPKKNDMPIEIMGVTITGTRLDKVLSKIWLQRKEMLHVATVNPEFVMEANENPRFAAVLKRCLTVADGWGVVWADKILNQQSPGPTASQKDAGGSNSPIGGSLRLERVSGIYLAEQMVARAARSGEKVFLLGAGEGVAEKAAQFLRTKYPQLQISWFSGAQTVKLEKNEEASMTIAKINAYEPDYLLVAYGSPWQDIWIEDNRPYLRARVAMGVGGVLDEWAGKVPACPYWIDQIGLKWLWRLGTQPWRVGRIARVLHFGFIVLMMRLKRVF